MGTTYSNCQVRSDSQEAVVAALRGLLKEPAYVAPAVNCWVGVYSAEEDSEKVDQLAKRLSAKLIGVVLFLSVYDSDIFSYSLYESGKRQDEFNSNPDYFEPVSKAKRVRLRGKPEVLVPYGLPGVRASQVQEVLHPQEASEAAKQLITFSPSSDDQYLFADHQATELARLLGMDETLASLGYVYFEEEETGDYALEDFQLIQASASKTKSRHSAKKPNSSQKKGAYSDHRDECGMPSLVGAARLCRPDFLQAFLDGGYNVNITVDASNLLSQQKRNPDLVKSLELIFNQRYGNTYENGFTALMAAAGASEAIDAITVAAGMSVEHPAQQLETVKVLLNAGADVNARSETGRTALSEALQMTDWTKHQRKIGRIAPEEVLRQAAERSAQVVEMLRAAGATE